MPNPGHPNYPAIRKESARFRTWMTEYIKTDEGEYNAQNDEAQVWADYNKYKAEQEKLELDNRNLLPPTL